MHMNSNQFIISASQPTGDGAATVSMVLCKTRSPEHFKRLCNYVRESSKVARGPRSNVRLNNRAVVVVENDFLTVSKAWEKGIISRVPKAGEAFPSIKDCAESLALSPQALSQMLYRARKANHGSDAPAKYYGITFRYAVADDTKVSI
jgi:hypothetical protein